MPKDRYSEFEANRDELDIEENFENGSDLQVLSMTLPGLFEKVNPIDEKLKILKSQVDQVRKIQKEVNAVTFVEGGDLNKMETIGEEIMSSSAQIRNDIEKIRDVDVRTDAKSRIKTLQIDRLSNQLRTIMNEFRSNQADYLSSSKARINRQMIIKGLSPTDISVNMSHENPSVFNSGFSEEVQDAKSDLHEMKERQKALEDMEKEIHEIHGVFKEMDLLVSEQGETLDTIEKNVGNAKEHVEKGEENLGEALRYDRRCSKIKIGIAVLVTCIAVLLIIALVIALVLKLIIKM